MLCVAPITLKDANAFVKRQHRHHGPTTGHKWSIALRNEHGALCAVAIAGRPVARRLDDGTTIEVLRLCTDGTPNACSMLYAATRRAAKAMGYTRIITYILASEPGTSLKAAGWRKAATTPGGEWTRPSRKRNKAATPERKARYEAP
jgi:hypothetical protein